MLEEKTISVHHTISEYYWLDAIDFLSRFDALWDFEKHKTGKIKIFVDLLMGCECALKSHVMLGFERLEPKGAYSKLRSASHRISTLADAAQLNSDRSDYNFLKKELSDFQIKIRYSLEAYDTFFPMQCNWNDADINYTKTIGCHPWVISIRNALSRLIEYLNPYFRGIVSNDLAALFENDNEVKTIITGYRR